MKSNIDMKNTTLCYIEDDNSYLMMHRTKKINDLNHDKWVGLGGKFEENETPFECARREIMEEASEKRDERGGFDKRVFLEKVIEE